MAQEQRVTGGSAYHGQHGQPHVTQRLRRKPTVANAQHVRHGFEQRPRILLRPVCFLETWFEKIVLTHRIT